MENYQYYKFHNIIDISTKKFNFLTKTKSLALTKEWKLILMNDGSFTQNLNSLTGKNIKLKTYYKKSNILINQKKSFELFGSKIVLIIN